MAFTFNEFDVPDHLSVYVGASADNPATFVAVSNAQMERLDKHLGIEPHHTVLEIGCGPAKIAARRTPCVRCVASSSRTEGRWRRGSSSASPAGGMPAKSPGPIGVFRFDHRVADNSFTNVAEHPLGAMGFTLPWIIDSARDAGLKLDDIFNAYWSGAHLLSDTGQDLTILSPR